MADQNRTLEIDVTLDNKDLKRKAQDTERQLGSIGQTARSLGPLIAGAFGTAAVAGFARAVFNTTAEFEKLNAMLKTATGSAQNAAIAFNGIKQFALETPFTIQQVTQAFLTLKNLGLDPSMEALRAYGNVAASMGKDVQQFIEAVADASVGEFERLKEFGIKASKEGENISFQFRGTTTVVKNTSDEIQNFLRGIGENDFAGAMEDQMNTMNGAISNAGVAFDGLANALGTVLSPTIIEVANAFAVATDSLRAFLDPTIQDEISNISEEIEQLGFQMNDLEAQTGDNTYLLERLEAERQALISKREELQKTHETELKTLADIQTQQPTSPAATGAGATTEGPDAVGEFGPMISEEEAFRRQVIAEREQVKSDIEFKAEQDRTQQALNQWYERRDLLKAAEEEEEARKKEAYKLTADYYIEQEQRKLQAAQAQAEARKRIEQIQWQSGVGIAEKAQGAIGALGKAGFEDNKAFAVGSTLISTFESAQNAYKALAGIPIVGPALGIAAAVKATQTGLKNVATIKKQKPGGSGGSVARPGSVGGGGGGAGLQGIVGQPEQDLATAPQAPQIKVVDTGTVLGKMVEEQVMPAINDALRRGVSLDLEFA